MYTWLSVYDREARHMACGLDLAPWLLQSPPTSFQPVCPSLWISSIRSSASHQRANRSAAFPTASSEMVIPWLKPEHVMCHLRERKSDPTRRKKCCNKTRKRERSKKEKIKDFAAWNAGSVNFNTYSALKRSCNSGQIFHRLSFLVCTVNCTTL